MKNSSRLGWLLVFVQLLVFIGFVVIPMREPDGLGVAVGSILIVAGFGFLVWAFISLGNALTANPVPLAHAELRTGGAFAVVRHPIYTALLIGLLGFVILMGSWWTFAWWLVACLFFWGKSHWEDSMLHAKFGASWEQWAHGTPALIPFTRYRRKSAP